MATDDVKMGSPPAPPTDGEDKYGGYSRFEIELEVRLSARATVERCPVAWDNKC